MSVTPALQPGAGLSLLDPSCCRGICSFLQHTDSTFPLFSTLHVCRSLQHQNMETKVCLLYHFMEIPYFHYRQAALWLFNLSIPVLIYSLFSKSLCLHKGTGYIPLMNLCRHSSSNQEIVEPPCPKCINCLIHGNHLHMQSAVLLMGIWLGGGWMLKKKKAFLQMLFYTPSPSNLHQNTLGRHHPCRKIMNAGEWAKACNSRVSLFTLLCFSNEICREILSSLTLLDLTEWSAVSPISIII